jgi:predicted permease
MSQRDSVAQTIERSRDRRRLSWLEDFVQDVCYGARTLRRSPIFTTLAIATLTLAIGANTAIFSVVDPLLFRDLPVRDPGSLVQFIWRYPGDPPLNLFGLDTYERFRERTTVFQDMAGLAPLAPRPRPGTEPLDAELVTGNFFHMLGVGPALGRLLDASDDTPSGAPAAVVSWRYWQHVFSGESRALGAIVDIDDPRLPGPVHAMVVGVAEPRFSGVTAGRGPDVWLSLGAIPATMRSRAGLALIARLKPGMSMAQARTEMRVLDQPRIDAFAQRDPQWRHVAIDVTPARAGLSTALTDQFAGPLSLLMAIAGMLLLLACANLSGMFLARGAARRHEMAVRVSLGAGRLRIVRQVLTESLLLAAAGGMLGAMSAPACAAPLLRLVTSGTRSLGPIPQLQVALDMRVLLFTAGVTTCAALLFGLAPSLAPFVSPRIAALRAGAAGTPPRSRRLFGKALVAAQVALSLSLISVGALFVVHLAGLRDRSLGFNRRSVLIVSVAPASAGREAGPTLYDEALRRLRAIPGVRSVAASGMTPMSGAAGSRFVRVEGYQEPQTARRRLAVNTVTPDYFATYGTPLVSGRDFLDSDAAHPRRVIVNAAMARQYFAGRDPIGQPLWFDEDRDPFEIVGLAGDAKYQDVRDAAPPTVYIYTPVFTGSSDWSLRTAVDPTAVAGDVRRVLGDVFGASAVGRVTTLEEQVDAAIVPERVIATLSGFLAAAGALLAAIGLYGLLAYTVARRTREIGIRIALGATRGKVMRMVVAEASRLVAVGVVVGAPVALWGKGLAAAMLEHLSPGGLMPLLIAIAAMVAVALVAACIPARRAARVDPVIALRLE